MTLDRAHAFSLAGYFLALALAAGVAVAAFTREPTVYRSTWCPDPETRAFVTVARATGPVQVLARLREIRGKLNELHPMLDLDSPPEPGTHAEIDALIRDLISDLDLARTPEEGARP